LSVCHQLSGTGTLIQKSSVQSTHMTLAKLQASKNRLKNDFVYDSA
jgi:hypothetical protein